MIYISEGLLYICFAILTGTLLLRLIPERLRPSVHVPDGVLLACVAAIPVLSFVPLHNLAMLFSTQFEISYGEMMRSILIDVNSGKAWVWTVVGSAGLIVLLVVKSFRKDRHMPKIALFVTLLLIVWLGYASHASSLSPTKGLIIHTAHFLGFTVWIGILFVAGWFAKDDRNWPAFLGWFSPVAIGAVILTLAAGFTLMTFTTQDYVKSWILPYGQALLLKHALILPLLVFAFTNGFLYRKMSLNNESFSPRVWLKAEGVVALLVLAATAVLGQQAPPHNVQETLQMESPSPLFTRIFQAPYSPDMDFTFNWTGSGLLLFAAALIMLGGIIAMYRARRPVFALAMGIFAAVFAYLGAMFSMA
ncbi:copper resistance D family protein [Paenibacillus sp. PAMC21692]|uniref:copper resistance D family protein n=1 Tax=Paenibacillus sp. PAMC21692 TaxID=2762320 RepID=UPI00164DD9AE|nr:CopD family protein [Paenibacillus sp. PAMC21692]QNK60087.1 CopD family protein [Paenibacillus sp. PAMC21692]